jgi:hypothetical protein
VDTQTLLAALLGAVLGLIGVSLAASLDDRVDFPSSPVELRRICCGAPYRSRTMSDVNRTFLAFAALVVLLVPLVKVAKSLDVGSWGLTAIGVAVMLLVSLIDREGFYGSREPPPR